MARVFLLLAALSMLQLSCHGQDRMRGPRKPSRGVPIETYGEGGGPVLNFYQRWISPVRGTQHCPMHPSCSQYAKISFERLPVHEAYIRSLERLLRCGNDLQFYPLIFVAGEIRWSDPVPIGDNPEIPDERTAIPHHPADLLPAADRPVRQPGRARR